MKNILLFGATGRTGKYVLEDALLEGYNVTALVRNPDDIKLSSSKLKLVKGSPYNLPDVQKGMQGCDVVISTLNNPRKSDAPWAKQLGPADVLERSIKNALTAMQENNITRIITLSTIGASENFAIAPFILRLLVKYTNMKIAFADHTKSETALRNSSINWTSVRAAALSDSEKEKLVSVDYDKKPAMYISRKNVAAFLVSIIDKPEYFKKTPIISER